MNFKGIKLKLFRFKRIFIDGWMSFVADHPRYNNDYYHSEITKMLKCGSAENGFATYQCLKCGKGRHVVNFSCKGRPVRNVENVMLETVWSKPVLAYFRE